jgi:hypothetical protein
MTDGSYVKASRGGGSGEDKLQYSTMLTIRASLVVGAGFSLARGVTIAVRWAGCTAKQG